MPLNGPGRLPSVENLIDKTPEQLIKVLDRFNITPDLKEIDRNAERAYQTFARSIEQGIEPDDALWERIQAQQEKEMTQTLRIMAKTAISGYRIDALGKSGQDLMWVTRVIGVCPSCQARHGKIKTLPEWKTLGLPGSGALLCGPECRCQLVPAGKQG